MNFIRVSSSQPISEVQKAEMDFLYFCLLDRSIDTSTFMTDFRIQECVTKILIH